MSPQQKSKMHIKTVFLQFTLMVITSHAQVICPQGLKANGFFKTPTNIVTSKAIPANTTTPLMFYNGLLNFQRLKNLGNGVETYVNEGVDSFVAAGILGQRIYSLGTGGVICQDKFMLHKARFLISSTPNGSSDMKINGKGAPLNVQNIYRNIKYGTFENAMNHTDGILILTTQLLVGPIPNPVFIPLQFLLSLGIIKKPGSEFILPSAFIFSFLDAELVQGQYYAFLGSYQDLNSGKHYPATHILPVRPPFSISYNQFKAFKNILGNDGKPINTAQPLHPIGSREVLLAKGFTQAFVLL